MKTKAGIIRPSENDRIEQAEVLDVGPEVEMTIKKGDTVFFEDWALIEIQTQDGEEVSFVQEKNIIAYAV